MNKELLNKILPYCGHGLKVAYENSIVNAEISKFVQMCEPSEDGEYFKPVLFSPDCLTRKIETEHGQEIPLIKMAKIAFPKIKNWRIETCRAESDYVNFLFDGSDFVAGFYKAFTVKNQWKLFQHLYSRHIAFNLEPEEYVSVESLEKNPYAK